MTAVRGWRLAICLWSVAAAAQSPSVPRNSAEGEQLEARVQAHPEDNAARAQLIRYYARFRVATDRSQILRGQHIAALVERDPANAVLGEPAGTLDAEGGPLADPYAYSVADRAWRSVLTRADAPARALANAAFFYRSPDPAFARQIASGGLRRFPNDPQLGAVAGGLDALAVLGATALDGTGTALSIEDRRMNSPEALAARREIESTANVSLLGAVTSFLTRQMPALRARLQPPQMRNVLDLAARCYERAAAFEPDNPAWTSGLRATYRTAANLQAAIADRHLYLERAARVPASDAENLSLLPELAQVRYAARDFDNAGRAANEALRLAGTAAGPASANAVHFANIVLGRLALRRGDLQEAKARLLAAGGTSGSPQLSGAGPDWQLAQELLAKKEKAVVLEYIDLCRRFWSNGGGKLDAWAASIRAGEWPAFGR